MRCSHIFICWVEIRFIKFRSHLGFGFELPAYLVPLKYDSYPRLNIKQLIWCKYHVMCGLGPQVHDKTLAVTGKRAQQKLR